MDYKVGDRVVVSSDYLAEQVGGNVIGTVVVVTEYDITIYWTNRYWPCHYDRFSWANHIRLVGPLEELANLE